MTRPLPDPLPEGLRAIGDDPAGRAWLATLPRILQEVAELCEDRSRALRGQD